MPEYGSVGFTLLDIAVAELDVSDETYGTPVSLEYGQKLEFKPVADNDMLKAYGMMAELLAVITHATGTLSQGLIDFSAYAIMIAGASASSESGSTPNRQKTLDYTAGGSGLPYFGLVGRLASTNGADMLLGFRKCMLDTIPGFTVEQNKFILPETSMKMIAINTTSRKILRLRKRETASTTPTDFNTFFA